MAYRRQDQRILAGSLNLMPPSDKTPEPDSPVLQNFRVDQQGQLRTRRGSYLDASGINGGAAFNSIYRTGNDRFCGVGDKLYSGAACATEVTDGFDGNPLSFVTFQDINWVMNRGKSGKVTWAAGDYKAWVPDSPTTKPDVAAGATTSTEIVDFETPVIPPADPWELWKWGEDPLSPGTYTFIPGTYSYDSGNYVEGAESLTYDCNPPGRWMLRQTLPVALDLSLGGDSRDDDQMHIWFYCEDSSAVDELVVELWDGSSPASSVTAYVQPNTLIRDRYRWNLIKIQRRLDPEAALGANTEYRNLLEKISVALENNDSTLFEMLSIQRDQLARDIIDRTPYFQASNDFDWTTVSGISLNLITSKPITVHWDQAIMIGSDDASLDGEYYWYYTYDTDDGHESNPSPISDAITLRKEPCTVSNILPSPDSQVTVVHLYRIGGPLDRPLRVKSILHTGAILSTSDTIDNATVQNLNVEAPFDSDPPPAARGIVGPYEGRIVAYSTAARPARMFWTPVSQPWKWPGAADENEGLWEDVGQDDDEIVYITNHKRQLWIYKQRSVWRLLGDPDTNSPEQSNASFGAVGQKCVASYGSSDFFVGPEGIYEFNGDFERLISQKISPIFKGDYVDVGGTYAPPMNYAQIATCVLCVANGRLRFCYPTGAATSPTVTLVLDLETGRWATEVAAVPGFTSYCAMYWEGQGGGLMGGTESGSLYQLEYPNALDGTTPIPVYWQSPFFDQGLPEQHKVYEDLTIDYRSKDPGQSNPAFALTVTAVWEDGTTTALGTLPTTTRTIETFRINSGDGKRSRRMAIRLDGTLDTTATIFAVYLHYYHEEREAKSFDSGHTNLGNAGVKQVDRLRFEITGAGTTTWKLDSDLPANVMANRLTSTFAATGGRKLQTVDLASVVDGRTVRVKATSSSVFQMHRAWLRVRLVGEWFDGGASEDWWSGRVLLPGRVNQLRGIQLDYDLPSGGSLTVSSDLPGGAMTVRRTIALTATTDRTRIFIPLDTPTPVEGGAFEFRITSAGVGRLYAGIVEARVVGAYIEGARGEYWDSGRILLPGRVNQLRGIHFEYDLTAGGTLTVSSDLPGGAMTVRRTITLAATTDRTRIFIPLDTPSSVEGGAFEFRVTSTGAGRLYGGTVEARTIGTYIDGILGEYWETLPFSQFGFEAFHLAREIEIDCDTTGALTLTVSSDMPGYNQATRHTATVNTETTTTGRRSVNIRLPATLAQQYQLKLSGTSAIRLYGMKIYMRSFGPQAQDWQWVSVPGIVPTQDSWTKLDNLMGIVPTSNDWTKLDNALGIHATANEWNWVEIPVDEVPAA
jgi:hypothetical protein